MWPSTAKKGTALLVVMAASLLGGCSVLPGQQPSSSPTLRSSPNVGGSPSVGNSRSVGTAAGLVFSDGSAGVVDKSVCDAGCEATQVLVVSITITNHGSSPVMVATGRSDQPTTGRPDNYTSWVSGGARGLAVLSNKVYPTKEGFSVYRPWQAPAQYLPVGASLTVTMSSGFQPVTLVPTGDSDQVDDPPLNGLVERVQPCVQITQPVVSAQASMIQGSGPVSCGPVLSIGGQ